MMNAPKIITHTYQCPKGCRHDSKTAVLRNCATHDLPYAMVDGSEREWKPLTATQKRRRRRRRRRKEE